MNKKNVDPLLDEPDSLADFDDNGDFSEFDQKNSNTSFGSLIKNNPLIKIGMVVAALIIVIGIIMLFGGKNTETPDSFVAQGSDLKETPGSAEVSPQMKQALEEDNQQRIEQAILSGDSVLPTPIEPPKERLPVPENTSEDDPLLRWRQMQEERAQAEQQTLEVAQQQGEPAAPVGPDPALGALTAAMSTQMSQVLAEKPAESIKYMQVTDLGALLAAMQEKEGNLRMGNNPNSDGNYVAGSQAGVDGQMIDPTTGLPVAPPKIMIRAGTIEYGQMILEANSDIPGPVVALMASGKFSGARLIGSFQKAEDDYLIITFNTLVDKKGVSIPIEAYAVDPNTTLTGLATDVDQRYWQRIILPAAADFIEGLGEAVADSGTTKVTVSGDTVIEEKNDIDTKQELYKGVERAAERVSDLLDEKGNKTQPLIRVAAGTPLGILFTTSVTDQDRLAGQYNPQISGGFQGSGTNSLSAQQQLLQSLTANGGTNNNTNSQDTEALLESLRNLQGQ